MGFKFQVAVALASVEEQQARRWNPTEYSESALSRRYAPIIAPAT
jgi:hypothetical protein